MSSTFFAPKLDLSGRDITCFLFAAGVHSLLLLWQGGLLTLPQDNKALGDMLVSVDFMSEVPQYGTPGGGAAAKPAGFFARMKSIMKGEGTEGKKHDLAMGNGPKPVEIPKTPWTKNDSLNDKAFSDKKGFQGMTDKENINIARGEVKEVVVKPSQGNFQQAEPNLKENSFKMARKDVPFKIASPQNSDALSNVNAIPVVVGRTTSPSVKSLDGGPGAGPAMQSKAFASKGATPGAGFSSGGSGKSDSAGGGMLAMGAGAGTMAAGGGSSAPSGGGASGYSSGSGSGTGSGTGAGVGSGNGGRTWGGGSGGGMGGTMQALPRHAVPIESGPAGMKPAKDSGFSITGALANRPITKKVLAKYEMDARVALRFRVDWSGRVLDGILVEISSGSPTFDQKVIASLKDWNFSRLPAERSNEIQEGVITFMFKGV